ncbi:MAG: hypothetical protein ACRCT8_00020 [Lacipirellulaceae bacterium]
MPPTQVPTGPLAPTMSAAEVAEREWPGFRGRLLELAATLDRVDRAPGSEGAGARRRLMSEALALVASGGEGDGERAERLQRLLSRAYDPAWRKTLGVAAATAGRGGA